MQRQRKVKFRIESNAPFILRCRLEELGEARQEDIGRIHSKSYFSTDTRRLCLTTILVDQLIKNLYQRRNEINTRAQSQKNSILYNAAFLLYYQNFLQKLQHTKN